MRAITSSFIILFAIISLGGDLFAGGNRENSFSEDAGGDPSAPVTSEEGDVVGEEAAAPESGDGEPAQVTGNATIDEETRRLIEASSLRAFPERVPSVDFSLPPLEGENVALSDYRGSVVLLNFWATWCPPCREELPSMVRLQEELGDEPFTILAVSLREDRDTVRSFLDENGFELPVLLDESGESGMQYGVRGIPTSYVVDTEGRVLAMLVGAREWDDPEVIELIRHLAEE